MPFRYRRIDRSQRSSHSPSDSCDLGIVRFEKINFMAILLEQFPFGPHHDVFTARLLVSVVQQENPHKPRPTPRARPTQDEREYDRHIHRQKTVLGARRRNIQDPKT